MKHLDRLGEMGLSSRQIMMLMRRPGDEHQVLGGSHVYREPRRINR